MILARGSTGGMRMVKRGTLSVSGPIRNCPWADEPYDARAVNEALSTAEVVRQRDIGRTRSGNLLEPEFASAQADWPRVGAKRRR